MTLNQNGSPTRTRSFSFVRPPTFSIAIAVACLALLVASWVYIISISAGKRPILSLDSLDRLTSFASELIGSNSSTSFWQHDNWADVVRLAGDTLSMSVLAAAMAGVFAFLLIPFASSNLMVGNSKGTKRWVQMAVVGFVRGIFIFTRSVPELLWALIVVFLISPGILAGAIALAIHNVGVIGRLGADIVEDVEPNSVTALKSSGSKTSQTYLLGVLPQVARQLLTFQFYRWEVIIRTTAVVGFVAASGLGYQLRLDTNFFRFVEVGQLLLVYLLIVWAVDASSTLARRAAK